jgi:hypothetical protein
MTETRSDVQLELKPCAQCRDLFQPARPSQAFCGPKCRNAFHVDHGASGAVASVRRINRGASVVIHLTGPAAESALQLHLGEVVRVVAQP